MKQYPKEYFQSLAKQLMFTLSDEEAEQLQEEFMVLQRQLERLEQIDTEGVEEMIYPFEQPTSFMREDEPIQPLSQKEALQNADHTNGAYVILPRVVK